MPNLSHRAARLSIRLVVATLAGTMLAAAAAPSPYFGRWTVIDPPHRATARGAAYRTLDIAPCGSDFCGISVNERGGCGAVLFRFLGRHADGQSTLLGHGKWGDQRKTVQIEAITTGDPHPAPGLELYLGDGHDFGGRSGSMPKYHAEYRRLGAARCTAR